MARLKNSVQYNTVNRKALTFDAEIVSNLANTNLERVEGDTITNEIDAAGLESEISSAEKFAALMRALGCLKCELEERLEELTYEVVCHASDFTSPFTVPDDTWTLIPFETVRYSPSSGSFSAGEFTAAKTGYYQVDVFFYDKDMTLPVVELGLQIGGDYDGFLADYCTIGTEKLKLQGSRKVYCITGQKIYASLYQNSGGDVEFNSVAFPGTDGYISISYAGGIRSATNL